MKGNLILSILLSGVIMILYISCMDSIKNKNKERFKPQDWFEGEYLPMAQAIYNGDTREIENQVKNRKIDPDGMSPNGRVRFLLYACIMEDAKTVETLLKLGADPNKVSPMRVLNESSKSSMNETPISFVVGRGNMELTKLLLKNKANPNTLVGFSAIHSALGLRNEKQFLDLLFEYGADASFQEYGDSKNSAQLALLGRRFELISYFLDKGADPLSLDMTGSSLAYSIQKELENFRGTEKARQQVEKIKQRLITEYHIKFPVKRDYEKGAKSAIQRFENLPQEVKDLYGMDDDAKFTQKTKDSLDVGKTYWGMTIEEVNNR